MVGGGLISQLFPVAHVLSCGTFTDITYIEPNGRNVETIRHFHHTLISTHESYPNDCHTRHIDKTKLPPPPFIFSLLFT